MPYNLPDPRNLPLQNLPILSGDTVPDLSPSDTVMGGATLNRNWWNYVPSRTGIFFRPDTIKLEDYEYMVQTDETVSSGLKFINLSVVSRLGEYTHPKKKIQTFVQECLDEMNGNLFFTAREILSALAYGFSVTEIIWRPRPDGRVGIESLETLHPRSILFVLDTNDNSSHKNNLAMIVQWPWTSYQAIFPLNKVILYSNEMEFGNFYGTSRLRPAYKNWYLKEAILKGWAITLERYGTPIAIARVPNAAQKTLLPDGSTGTNIDLTLGILEQLKNGTSLAIDKDTEIQIAEVQRALGADFDQFIKYLNSMIYRSLLLPTLVADHDSQGSYSLGRSHFDLFTMNLDYILRDLCTQLTYQLIRPLIEINFGPQKTYGEFRYRAFQQDDLRVMSEVFMNATNTGIISPEQRQDLDYMRKSLGIPEVDTPAETPPDVYKPMAIRNAEMSIEAQEKMRKDQARTQLQLAEKQEKIAASQPNASGPNGPGAPRTSPSNPPGPAGRMGAKSPSNPPPAGSAGNEKQR